METRTLTAGAEKLVLDYLNLPIAGKFVRTPYYNNKRNRVRGGLRALIGKGTPGEIVEEALLYSMREKIKLSELEPQMLSKFLVDHNLGIDCSGLAYHILDTESSERGFGHLSRHLHYPYNGGLLGRFVRFVRRRYVEKTDTMTLAHASNSREVAFEDVAPGDMVVLLDRGSGERNHVLVVKAVEEGQIIMVHSIANPEDGKYNHGVRLEIVTKSSQLLNEIRERFRAKNIWLRRLNWL